MTHITKMWDKKGADFDKDYISLMVDDHKEDVIDFGKAAQDAKDPDGRAFPSKHVATLKRHYERACAIKDMLK